MALSKHEKIELVELFAGVLDSRGHNCNAEHCEEVCGITPVKHGADHRWLYNFKVGISWAFKTFIAVLIVGLAGFLLTVLSNGFGLVF